MGWFKKALTKVVKSPFGKVMDTFSAVFTHPIKAATAIVSKKSTIKGVTKAHFEQPLKTQITQTILTTGGYVATLYAGAAVATKGLAASVGTLIPTTLKGKVIAAVVAPVALGAVIKSPELVGKTLSAPAELAQFGGDVASFAADPSLAGAKQIITESPLISAGIAAAGLVIGGAAVSGVLQRQEMKKQTAALEASAAAAAMGGKGFYSGESPILPERTSVSPTRAPSKRRRATKTPSVRQSLRVNIINKPVATGVRILNKRYINQELLN